MKSLSLIVIFISMISFGYAFETIEKSMDVFELEIVDFEEIENLEDLDYLVTERIEFDPVTGKEEIVEDTSLLDFLTEENLPYSSSWASS